MKIKVIASTKVGYVLPKEEAIDFSGKSAGICYLPDTVETLFAEAPEKTQRRANGNLESGHHSVFGHAHYNLIFEGIPKILAMILNNEKIYNTSEKSARYTKMEPSEEEKVLYEKWIEKYKKVIKEEYPELKADKNYMSLQNKLSDLEDEISNSRIKYNKDVLKYKNEIEKVPSNIIANIFKFKPELFFEIDKEEKENQKISFK